MARVSRLGCRNYQQSCRKKATSQWDRDHAGNISHIAAAGSKGGFFAESAKPQKRGMVFSTNPSKQTLVSAAGFEPATHALKGSPTQLQTTTCTSSFLHARHNKINEMPTRHRSRCPEGARNPASRTMSLRVAVPNVTRRIHFAKPSSIRSFRVALMNIYNDLTVLGGCVSTTRLGSDRPILGRDLEPGCQFSSDRS